MKWKSSRKEKKAKRMGWRFLLFIKGDINLGAMATGVKQTQFTD
jgi:hypothetical protein